MNKMMKILFFAILVTSLVTGCQQKGLKGLVPARGQVLYDDSPLEGALVTFSPQSGEGRSATGITDASGMFSMGTLNPKDGVAPGEYLVTVTKYEVQNPMTPEERREYDRTHDTPMQIISKAVMSEKYALFDTSDLSATVPGKGTKEIKFELKSR